MGTSAVGQAGQGISVALSADGNTAFVEGLMTTHATGRRGSLFATPVSRTQQGSKLVGAGAVGNATQGAAVALSADGNTVIVGGSYDNLKAGAAWVFTRSGGDWTQQSKLVGTGAVGNAAQGSSVALSADGNTAIVGGPFERLIRRGGVGLCPQRRRLEATRQQTDWHRRGRKSWTRLLRCDVR